MQDPLTENPETSTLNPDIHGVKSRIQDCLGFPLLEYICSVPTIKIASVKKVNSVYLGSTYDHSACLRCRRFL